MMKKLINKGALLLFLSASMIACGGEEGSEEEGSAITKKEICLTVDGKEKCYKDAPGNFSADWLSGELTNNFGLPKDRQARVIVHGIGDDLKAGDAKSMEGKSYTCDVETKDHGMNEGLSFKITATKKLEDADEFMGARYLLKGELSGANVSKGSMTLSAPVGEKIAR